ncbi:arylamine N-acetyltransferase [Metabacillus sp. KIGAM252]|uniref:Arylamine N-acetyltransferase n=1 Tax=Metabacillus flavus TaxID=2823519 RepID=A0ABS5LJI8_9BACI|nr:arylamine N-acetyltransferase [Metabacillus flavus]MBS2970905.1 arylamine N-acetyltransferase [Metabacillus flavus]
MKLHPSFLKRIGLKDKGRLQFRDLETILTAFSYHIPFENLSILQNKRTPLDAEALSNKIIEQKQGGVCYELNPILYYFLLENNLDAQLVQGTVFNHEAQEWSLSGTHAAVLIRTGEGSYILDAGFGTNVAQKQIPMNGEIIESSAGQFRIIEKETSEGSHLLEMKLAEDAWKTGYAFNADSQLNLADLQDMQAKIHEHPDSPFNKKPLAAMRMEAGFKTLSPSSFSVTEGGHTDKHGISAVEFAEIAEREFGLH